METKSAESPSGAKDAPEEIRFLIPGANDWESAGASTVPDAAATSAARAEKLSGFLLSSMQMPNLLVLAGSGTSTHVGGPSMPKLWERAVGKPPSDGAQHVFEEVRYGKEVGEDNIEDLLSRCDARLFVDPKDATTAAFRLRAIEQILIACRTAGASPDHDMTAHKEMLRRLARRRARDPRVRLFTTNYDLCFERSASELGLVALDGFSFFEPRRFDPRYFEYDIVKRGGAATSDGPHFVAGVFQYFKLHGSVNWMTDGRGSVSIDPRVAPDRACLIYPTREKYRFSFQQPHLELMAQFLSSLRQPNTCLVIVGFGFRDDHLSEPIFSALEANPHLRVVISSPRAEDHFRNASTPPWQKLTELFRRGIDIGIVATSFKRFASLIPDLRALSPGERLERAVRGVAEDG